MIFKIYAYFDKIHNCYMPPVCKLEDPEELVTIISRSKISENYKDLSLKYLGVFNDDTGYFNLNDQPLVIADIGELFEKQEKGEKNE